MPTMSDAERRRFLLTGTRTAKVATTRVDGRPHVAAVWFLLDGEDLVFTTGIESVKGRNLQRDPRVAICVDDDDQYPFAFVLIEGTASLSTERGDVRRWAGEIGGRYLGQDRIEELADINGGPTEMVVRVTPRHIVSEDAVAV